MGPVISRAHREKVLGYIEIGKAEGARVATGGRAEYFRNEDRIVLTGSPRVVDGANSVQGHEIVLYSKENRSVVKGGQDGRVNAVFQPKQEVPR